MIHIKLFAFGTFLLLLASISTCAISENSDQETENVPVIEEKTTKEAAGEVVKEVFKKDKPTRPNLNIPLSEDLQEYTWKMCQEYDLSYKLVLAVMKTESNFKATAVSYNESSLGLMQLNKNTYPTLAKELDIKSFNPFNPKHNIRAGTYYLSKIRNNIVTQGYSEMDIVPATLLTYNKGATGAKNHIKKYGVSGKYIDKVMSHKSSLEGS